MFCSKLKKEIKTSIKNITVAFIILLFILLSLCARFVFAESIISEKKQTNAEKNIVWFDKKYGEYYILGDSIIGAPLYDDGKYSNIGFIDKNSKSLINEISMDRDYTLLSIFENFKSSEGIIVFSKDNKFGYIDEMGNKVVKEKFEDAEKFSKGMAKVRIGGKCGYIDVKGNYVIEPKYDDIDKFSDNRMVVKLDRKYGFVDYKGKVIVEPKYEYIGKISEGMAEVQLNGECGFIDESAREVIKPKYDSVSEFNEGMVAVELDNKWGFIDKSGKVVIKPKYERVSHILKVCPK